MTSIIDWLRSGAFPLILQTESAECGMACLAMIARHHGHDIDLPALRRRFSTSLKGNNLTRIAEMANDLGLSTRAVKVELEQLKLLNVPVMMHWDMNHFVVLVKATRTHLVIHDPAIGAREITYAYASEHFTGVAAEFSKLPDFRRVNQRETLSIRQLIGHVKGVKRSIVHVLVMAVALEFYIIASPLLVQWTMDGVIVRSDWGLLNLLVSSFLLLAILQATMTLARASALNWINYLLSSQWPRMMYSHFIRLPVEYFQKRNLSDLISRFNSLQTIQRTLTSSFVEAILDGVMVVFMAAILWTYSSVFIVLIFAGFCVYILTRYLARSRLQNVVLEQIIAQASCQSELMESARGIQTIKLFGIEPLRDQRFTVRAHAAASSSKEYQSANNIFTLIKNLIVNIIRVIVIWLAAREIIANNMTAGMLVASLTYANQILIRSISLVDILVEWDMLKIQTERLSDIALTDKEQILETSSTPLEKSNDLEFRDVTFRYSKDEVVVIDNLSLHIEDGEAVAIVGPSGCGKTTLAKLAMGLLEPESGKVFFGGKDIREFGLRNYRSQVSTVMQDDVLFTGSVAENISMFDPLSTIERIEEAARDAQIDAEIVELPMAYETLVGEMGSVFSGGQKQRLLLARALYRKPRLLVLDEATSHLDHENELRVNAVIRKLAITRLIIAHRQETIAMADRVITLNVKGV